ncbi:Adenylate cyclase, partial [Gilliamella apicola SCGC AB-598-B02]
VSNNKAQGRPLNILDETNELPKEIDSVAYQGVIQFFFEDTDIGFDLYILNEHNQIEIYRNCNGNRETCEELGLSINEITILGQLPKFIATLGMIIYPFVGKLDSIDDLKLNFDEVESIFTVPLEWFKNNQPLHATMQVGHKPDNDFPYNLLPNRSKDWQKRSEHLVYFY